MQNIECVFTDCIHNEHLENSIKGCCNAKDILIDFNKCASYEKTEGFKKRNLIKELRKCIDALEVDSTTYQETVCAKYKEYRAKLDKINRRDTYVEYLTGPNGALSRMGNKRGVMRV